MFWLLIHRSGGQCYATVPTIYPQVIDFHVKQLPYSEVGFRFGLLLWEMNGMGLFHLSAAALQSDLSSWVPQGYL